MFLQMRILPAVAAAVLGGMILTASGPTAGTPYETPEPDIEGSLISPPGGPESTEALRQIVALWREGHRDRAKMRLERFLDEEPANLQALELSGIFLMEEGNYQAAAQTFERVLRDDPGRSGAHAKRGLALVLAEQQDAAESAFRAAVEIEPTEPLALYYLGFFSERRGDIQAARAYYQQLRDTGALDEGPLTRAHLSLARFHASSGEYEDTFALLDAHFQDPAGVERQPEGARLLALAAMELDRTDRARELVEGLTDALGEDQPQVRLVHALLEHKEGRSTEALDALETVIEDHPDYRALAWLHTAQIHTVQAEPEQAQEALRAAGQTGRAEDASLIFGDVAQLMIAHGDVAGAVDMTRAFAARFPEHPNLRLHAAMIALRTEQLDASREVLDELLDAHPEFGPARLLAGQIARHEDNAEKATEHFRAAVDFNPEYIEAWVHLAALQRQVNGPEQALTTLERSLAANPEHPVLLFEQASLLHALDKQEEANVVYEKIIASQPDHVAALNNLALNLHALEGPDERSLALAERAHELAPDHPFVQDTYGWILVAHERFEEGLPLLEAAAEGAPQELDIQVNLGLAYSRAGHLDEARQTLEAALAQAKDKDTRELIETELSSLN